MENKTKEFLNYDLELSIQIAGERITKLRALEDKGAEAWEIKEAEEAVRKSKKQIKREIAKLKMNEF